MAEALLIDGAAAAKRIKDRVAERVARLLMGPGQRPGLAAVQVGDNPASQVYVRNKVKTARELGLLSIEHRLPAETTEEALLALVRNLNADPKVHGILVQLPLPSHVNSELVLETIAPSKDVDGFHPMNAGRLAIGKPAFVPCTPLGCLRLIKDVRPKIGGLNAVVVGRSNIVGKPVASLLLMENCTVTIAHSRTKDLPAVCRGADILVAAVGKPEMIHGDWVKPGAIVIDVGINRVPAPNGKTKLVGDVDFASAKSTAGAITPVPGGVGPMTVAYLMMNTCRAAELRHGRAPADLL